MNFYSFATMCIIKRNYVTSFELLAPAFCDYSQVSMIEKLEDTTSEFVVTSKSGELWFFEVTQDSQTRITLKEHVFYVYN